MRVYPGSAQSAAMMPGASATDFLFPLVIGISVLTVLLAMVVAVSPTDEEIQLDAALNARFARPQ
jgi:hypothetical protein